MKISFLFPGAISCIAAALLTGSCANFRKLGRDLAMIDNEYRIHGIIENVGEQRHPVIAAVVEWDRKNFLDAFDPAKTPVHFVHGAAGSPQDWRHAMERIDRRRYQPWFYVYPSGMRLDNAADALDKGIHYLHQRYRFERLDVVAHSMGGLVSRRFILNHLERPGAVRIPTFITFSSPWGGHEAAAMGVRRAPEVVPSWRDMSAGSAFLEELYKKNLKGRVNHHLFYSHRASRSMILPEENDGTVSVS